MKKFLLVAFLVLTSFPAFSQTIPNLPIAIGVGSAEVWGDSIYHFGGATTYGGGTRFSTIYKYDGNNWQNFASTPDNDMFGISSTINGDSAYVYGGYSFGNNKLRIYNFITNTWVYAANSPNISSTYGHTIEYVDGFIYLFFNGYVYKYNISTNSWTQATTLSQNGSWLFSTVYQEEVYLVGWTLARFYKYNPADDQWTQLADLPYFVTGGALQTVDDKIYCVGGSSGSGGGSFNNTLVYDIATNQWNDAGITLSGKKAYMSHVIYNNNFYVIGGLDENGNAVDDVEFIVAGTPSAVETDFGMPNNFYLSQNYPNPFNPSTNISFSIPTEEFVSLKVFNSLGEEVFELINETKPAGNYSVFFDASRLTSGVYFYQVRSDNFVDTKKMILLK
jgi:hypothetical protein